MRSPEPDESCAVDEMIFRPFWLSQRSAELGGFLSLDPSPPSWPSGVRFSNRLRPLPAQPCRRLPAHNQTAVRRVTFATSRLSP